MKTINVFDPVNFTSIYGKYLDHRRIVSILGISVSGKNIWYRCASDARFNRRQNDSDTILNVSMNANPMRFIPLHDLKINDHLYAKSMFRTLFKRRINKIHSQSSFRVNAMFADTFQNEILIIS